MADQVLQSIGIVFNAASLLAGAAQPPFRTQIKQQQQSGASVVTVNLLTIDATMQETHSATAEVTEHPVEVGSDITDHIRPKPLELRLDGVVTNSPLSRSALATLIGASPLGPGLAVGEAVRQALIGTSDFAKDAFAALRKIRDNGTLVVLVTPYQQYESMAMVDLQVVRTPDTGDALHFSATFRQIVTVDGATVVTLAPIAQEEVALGAQSTSTANSALTKSNSTVLNKMFGKKLDGIGLALPPRLPALPFGLPGQ